MNIFQKFLRKFFHVEPHMRNHALNFQNEKVTGVRIGSHNFIDGKDQLFLKDFVYIGHFNFIEASNKIYLGKGVQITSHVSITSHSSHDAIRMYGSAYYGKSNLEIYQKGEISIGDFTFIGPKSTIAPGTTIGKGCIVSAGSFVKGNFPDFSLIGGTPAVVISSLKDKDEEILNQYPELRKTYMK